MERSLPGPTPRVWVAVRAYPIPDTDPEPSPRIEAVFETLEAAIEWVNNFAIEDADIRPRFPGNPYHWEAWVAGELEFMIQGEVVMKDKNVPPTNPPRRPRRKR